MDDACQAEALGVDLAAALGQATAAAVLRAEAAEADAATTTAALDAARDEIAALKALIPPPEAE